MTFFVMLLAYIMGSINFALVIGKLFYKADIREHGSGNLGATNSLVVLGKKAAVVVLIGDAGKGVLAFYLPILFGLSVDPLFIGFCAILGHCFPIFANFKGGKAIATTAGVLLVFDPVMFLLVYVLFILIAFLTKYVFFGSISVGISSTLYSIFFINSVNYIVLFAVFTLLLVYLHRSNIRNFLQKNEPKINDKKNKEKRIQPKK